MDSNRPDIAAILLRKALLAEVKMNRIATRSAQQVSETFHDWPYGHIDYFCNAHDLIMIATPSMVIEIRPVADAPPVPFFIST